MPMSRWSRRSHQFEEAAGIAAGVTREIDDLDQDHFARSPLKAKQVRVAHDPDPARLDMVTVRPADLSVQRCTAALLVGPRQYRHEAQTQRSPERC